MNAVTQNTRKVQVGNAFVENTIIVLCVALSVAAIAAIVSPDVRSGISHFLFSLFPPYRS